MDQTSDGKKRLLLTVSWWLVAVIALGTVALFLECTRWPPRMSGDSHAYLQDLVDFTQTGEYELRERLPHGVPLVMLGLSRLHRHPTREVADSGLMRVAVRYVSVVWLTYLLAVAFLAYTIGRRYGMFWAALAFCPFVMDAYFNELICGVVSDGLVRNLIIAWMACLIRAYHGRDLRWLYPACLLASLAFYCREASLPGVLFSLLWVLAMLAGAWRQGKFGLGGGVARLALYGVCLAALPASNVIHNGVKYGFWSMSDKGIHHLVDRSVCMADLSRIDWSKQPEYYRPCFDAVRADCETRRPADGKTFYGTTWVPMHKKVMSVGWWLEKHFAAQGRTLTKPELYAMLKDISRTGFASNPWGNIRLSLRVYREYLTLPFTRDIDGYGRSPLTDSGLAVIVLALLAFVVRAARRKLPLRDALCWLGWVGFFVVYGMFPSLMAAYRAGYAGVFLFVPVVGSLVFLAGSWAAFRGSTTSADGCGSGCPAVGV